MSPTQRAIANYLEQNAGRWIGGYELRDAVCPRASEKSVHVQLWKMRKAGFACEGRSGPYGGYRVTAPQPAPNCWPYLTHRTQAEIREVEERTRAIRSRRRGEPA